MLSPYLPNGYTSNAVKKIPKHEVEAVALSLGMRADTKVSAVVKALDGGDWRCQHCGAQTELISYNQGFRKFCSSTCANSSSEVQQKRQTASLKKHGTEWPNQAPDVKQKIKNSLIKRLEPARSAAASLIEQQGFKVTPGETFSSEWTMTCNCGHQFSRVPPTWERWSSDWKTVCPSCSAGSSSQEKNIALWIEARGFDIVRRDRTQIAPLELDIYIPALRLAIEYNGLYWHSDDKQRHLKKLTACLDKNIKLIQIFENDWFNRREVIYSRLQSALGLNERAYARNTKLLQLSGVEARMFFDENHLALSTKGGHFHLGLEHEGKLVQAISIGKARFSRSGGELELLRSASAAGITVVGGLSKLMRHAQAELDLPIMTYADRCWGEGTSYLKAGARFIRHSGPSYFWWKNGRQVSRYATWKGSIGKVLGDAYVTGLSEQENMRRDGWRQMWNAGNSIYRFD